MSNIIIIVSNITNISVAQCYFILKFYILWLWPMVSITRALQVPPPLISLPLPHFHQGCMLFYKPSFSSFVIYMCFIRRFFTVLPWWNYESIISRFHYFLFDLSSNHVTEQRNSWIENYKLLFFFSISGEAKFEVNTTSIISHASKRHITKLIKFSSSKWLLWKTLEGSEI